MLIKQSLALAIIMLLSNTLLTMQLNTKKNNYFNILPKELVTLILIQEKNEYPWENFKRIYEKRLVCKQWHESTPSMKNIQRILDIPDIHFLAMTNKPKDIVKLKLAGHSQLAPDKQHFNPIVYAVACKQHKAIKVLMIGPSINDFIINKITPHIQKKDKKTKQIIKYSTTLPNKNVIKKYSIKNLIKATKKNNYKNVVNFLLKNINLSHPPYDFTIPKSTSNDIKDLLLYARQSSIEEYLFRFIMMKQELPQKFFQQFIMLEANPNVYNYGGLTPLHYCAIIKDDIHLLTLNQLLKLKNIDIDKKDSINDETPIIFCAIHNNHACLKKLLDFKKQNNIPLSDTDHHAFNIAIAKNEKECINLFMQHPLNENYQDPQLLNRTFLHFTSEYNRPEILATLLEKPNCNTEIQDNHFYTPLQLAVIFNSYDCINILIKKGACTTHLSKNLSSTLLDLAAENNSTQCLNGLVIQLKNQINTKNCFGYTPLITATIKNNLECSKILIKANANINASSNNGDTALHFAASKGFCNAIKLLIENGASLNSINVPDRIINQVHYGNYTPLHFAAHNGHYDAVKILLDAGADTKLTTQLGKTALNLAKEHNHLEIVEMLNK